MRYVLLKISNNLKGSTELYMGSVLNMISFCLISLFFMSSQPVTAVEEQDRLPASVARKKH